MPTTFDFQSLGNWRLLYFQRLIGNEAARQVRGIPLIEPIELPISVSSRVLAVSAIYAQAPPTWNLAGYLYQEIQGINLDDSLTWGEMGGSPAVVDASKRRVQLNATQLFVFPRLASESRFRFEAAYWMPRLNLGIWEYIGAESDSTADLINAARVDLARIEFKVDQL
jgi:hypothetical protein